MANGFPTSAGNRPPPPKKETVQIVKVEFLEMDGSSCDSVQYEYWVVGSDLRVIERFDSYELAKAWVEDSDDYELSSAPIPRR